MQETPKGNRLHIAIFGKRNAGKSSLINALTNQELALVSEVPGTTTDPVYKAMEILPIGPCMLIDTAGIDDTGPLGELRIEKTKKVLEQTDLVLLVIDPVTGIDDFEMQLKQEIESKNIPIIGIINKIDLGLIPQKKKQFEKQMGFPLTLVSSKTQEGIEEVKKRIIENAPKNLEDYPIISDLVKPGDVCIMVIPIDSGAPKGRLILPQMQTIRDLLDSNALALTTRENQLAEALQKLQQPPKIVVTDSQVFKEVAEVLPGNIPLTSFSILFARHKGDLNELVNGIRAIATLKPGDKVLICEACTHHPQEDDIGTVKIPNLLRQRVGADLNFHFSSGIGYPENLEEFKLVIHCGGCMINRRQMLSRIQQAREKGVPIVNYGVFLAYANGILERALEPFDIKNSKY